MNPVWKCPVCGFEAKNDDEIDKHIQETGHVLYDDLEDKGQETPKEPDDLSFTKHTGYAPGISSGDVQSNESDLKAKKRVQGNSPKK